MVPARAASDFQEALVLVEEVEEVPGCSEFSNADNQDSEGLRAKACKTSEEEFGNRSETEDSLGEIDGD